jgi:hypothetical protein
MKMVKGGIMHEGAWNLEDGNDVESYHKEPLEVDSIDEEEDVELPDDASSAEYDTDKCKAVGLSDDKGNKNQVYLDDQSFEQANNGLLYDNYNDEGYTSSSSVVVHKWALQTGLPEHKSNRQVDASSAQILLIHGSGTNFTNTRLPE